MPEEITELQLPSAGNAENNRTFGLTIEDKIDPVRLDQFVVNFCTDISRSLIKKAIDAGKVTVNGKPAKASAVGAWFSWLAFRSSEPLDPYNPSSAMRSRTRRTYWFPRSDIR